MPRLIGWGATKAAFMLAAGVLSLNAEAVNPKLAMAERHMLLLATDGSVWTWGERNASYPLLGRGRQATSAPAQVSALGRRVVDVAAAGATSLALLSDGTVWAWGDSTAGQSGRVTGLSDADPSYLPDPVQVPGLSGITQVALSESGRAGFALDAQGQLWSWGDNGSSRGILAVGPGSFTRVPPARVDGVSGLTQLAPNGYQALASRNDGTLWGWGTVLPPNHLLVRSLATSPPGTSTVLRPEVLLPAGITGELASTTIGNYEAGAVLMGLRRGQVWAWGELGEMGDGLASCHRRATAPMPQEQAIAGLEGIQHVAAAGMAAVFADDAGRVTTCGDNTSGQLGDGSTVSTSAQKPGPQAVQGLPGGAIHGVYMGERNGGVIYRDGSVYLWGQRDDGRLGDGGSATGLATSAQRLGIHAGAVPMNAGTSTPQVPTATLPGYVGVQSGLLSATPVQAYLRPGTSHVGQRGAAFMAAMLPDGKLLLFSGATQQWTAFDPAQPLPFVHEGVLGSEMTMLNLPQGDFRFASGITLFLGYGIGASAADAGVEMLQSRRYAPTLVLR